MKLRAGFALGVAAFALTPSGALAATPPPDPAMLRAILPDPGEPTWVEVDPGTPGFLDGPVTIDDIRAYYTYYQQSQYFIAFEVNTRQKNGFVGGCVRQWYRPHLSDYLDEEIDVYATAAGAATGADAFKNAADQNGLSSSHFDPGLGPEVTGELASASGAYFANVIFIKGNATYAAGLISNKALTAQDVVPQARLLYDRAPNDIPLVKPQKSVLAQNYWLFAFAALALMLAISGLMTVIAISLLAPRRRYSPPAGASGWR